MKEIRNHIIEESLYSEVLDNGLTVMIMEKKDFDKKYVIWATKYGSIDNEFIVPGESEVTKVPDGIAHFLEHKMFEQKNGTNSLDTLTNLGAEANAYTTTNHTAYLFSCTDKFDESLSELMDYVQNPYFTDENVEKEKGIIEQEIAMYDDNPDSECYVNFLENMYINHPIRKKITGTKESISQINKELLYSCYKTFYHPSNMVMFLIGDFNKDEILSKVKERLLIHTKQDEIKRIIPKEPKNIKKDKIIKNMDVNLPIFLMGYKEEVSLGNNKEKKETLKKHVSLEIILEALIGKSSKLYETLYEQRLLLSTLGTDFEFIDGCASIQIYGQSPEPEKVVEEIAGGIKSLKKQGIDKKDFERIKKMIGGEYLRTFNNVERIANMFVSDYMKGINSFDYIDLYQNIEYEYVENVLKNSFNEEAKVISIIKGK